MPDECTCAVHQLACNPDRTCTRCKKFIPLESIEEGIAWGASLRGNYGLRCRVCWRGQLHCDCGALQRLVRDALTVDGEAQATQVGFDAAE